MDPHPAFEITATICQAPEGIGKLSPGIISAEGERPTPGARGTIPTQLGLVSTERVTLLSSSSEGFTGGADPVAQKKPRTQ